MKLSGTLWAITWASCVALFTTPLPAQTEADKKWIQEQGIPPEAREKLAAGYEILFNLNPFYLRGDFNGDGKADLALRIKEKTSGKIGIAVLHAGAKNVIVLGAGQEIGNGGDDLSYLDVWYVHPAGKASQGATDEKPPLLKGEAIYVEKTESASALIYWTGKAYRWYQQGD